MASSRNLVSTIGALASPKMRDGTRCPEVIFNKLWSGWPFVYDYHTYVYPFILHIAMMVRFLET